MPSVSKNNSSSRWVSLDIIRGFLLILMVINHSPSPIRRVTDQPLGFFSTAEGFVFVSAFLAGMLFQRRAVTKGFAAAHASTLARAIRIYKAHLLTLLFTFAVGTLFLAHLPGLQNLLHLFLINPWPAIVSSLALAFQPPLMDILPMYVVFSLLTPLAFWCAEKWGWKKVFLVSFTIWTLSQFRVRDLLLSNTKNLSFVNLGPFDVLSWQLLWVGGLIFGRSAHDQKPVFRLSFSTQVLLGTVVAAFMLWRWACIYFNVDPGKDYWFLDKWHLGPLRLFDFCVVAWFAAKALPVLDQIKTALNPLALIGRHMLPVFSCQICLSLIFVGWLDTGFGKERLATTLVIVQVATIFLSAWLFEQRDKRKKRATLANEPLTPQPVNSIVEVK
jgi:hypothetical protein